MQTLNNTITPSIRRKRILAFTERIDSLPTLPTVVYEVMDLINSGSASAVDITKIIAQDQSLTSKVLRIVNSAFYGFPGKITTINHAIVILGFSEIRNLLLSTTVFEMFNDGEEGFDRTEFWKHSIGCGIAGKMLAKQFRYRVSGEVFVAGILHDIGKVVLDQYVHEDLIETIQYAKEQGISFVKAEEELLGITHAEIGKLLLGHWKLPPDIVEVVECHHTPAKAKKNPELTALIHFSDILCKIKGIGSAGNVGVSPIDPFVWNLLKKKKLDLNKTDIEKFIFDLGSEIEKSNSFMFLAKEKNQ